ncbi:MAG: hypothetical protein ACFFC7_11135 [Candidatus Hermodarchaeota archaeon]
MKVNNIPFLTHEVGSLRKPNPLIRASRNIKLESKDFQALDNFVSLMGMPKTPPALIDLLKQAGPDQETKVDFHNELNRWRVNLNIKFKESTGIDLVDVGEWMRREMYQHVIDNDILSGIQLLSHGRSFDYNFWRPGIYLETLDYNADKSIYLQEFTWAKEFATKPLKVCVTGFNTVAEWTIHGRRNFEDLLFELIEEVYVPEVVKLLDAGADWIQLDEPALTTYPNHVEVFTDAWNYFVSKIKDHMKSNTVLGLHNCYSDYNLLWPILPELKGLGAVTLEFANRDSWELGVHKLQRLAYFEYADDIKNLYESGFNARVALGVLPVHTDHETSPELIRDRLLAINTLINDPTLILGAPDCGLRQRSLPVAHKLLRNLVKGAELAREEIE